MSFGVTGGGIEPNLGIVDYGASFKAPTGIGVKIDAKAIRGGGFLTLDADKGEYAGVLELTFKGLTIKAIGLLNTKAPGAGRLVAAAAAVRRVPGHAVGGRSGLHDHRGRRDHRPAAPGLGRPAAQRHRDERLRRHPLPGRPGARRAADHQPPAHPVPGVARRPGRRADGRGQLGQARPGDHPPGDPRPVRRGVRRRRLPLHAADPARHGAGRRRRRCRWTRRGSSRSSPTSSATTTSSPG